MNFMDATPDAVVKHLADRRTPIRAADARAIRDRAAQLLLVQPSQALAIGEALLRATAGLARVDYAARDVARRSDSAPG